MGLADEAPDDVARPHRGSLARWAIRHHRKVLAAIFALAAVNLFWHLAGAKVRVYDEPYYGAIAYEMIAGRNWIRTTFLGETDFWNLKPPLGYWLIAGCYEVFGFNRLAMRVPSALSALATIVVWTFWLRRRFSRRVAMVGGAFLAVAYPFMSQHTGRTGEVDAQLALVLTVALVLWPGAIDSTRRLLAVAFVLSLGFLLKSFAILSAASVMGAHLAVSGDWRRIRIRRFAVAAAAFAILPALWAWARYREDGTVFLSRMVSEDLFQRYTSDIDNCGSDYFGYLSSLLQRGHPAAYLLVIAGGVALHELRQRGRSPRLARWWNRRTGYLLLWFAVPLALFSLSRTQHRHYINPIYPAFTALGAVSLWFLAGRCGRIAFTTLAALALVGMGIGEWCILSSAAEDAGPHPQDFLVEIGKRLHRGQDIVSVRPWTGIEVFILEVEDGLRLQLADPAGVGSLPPGSYLLLDASASVPVAAIPIAAGEAYSLYRTAGDVPGEGAR